MSNVRWIWRGSQSQSEVLGLRRKRQGQRGRGSTIDCGRQEAEFSVVSAEVNAVRGSSVGADRWQNDRDEVY
jgi:hypothetical protein